MTKGCNKRGGGGGQNWPLCVKMLMWMRESRKCRWEKPVVNTAAGQGSCYETVHGYTVKTLHSIGLYIENKNIIINPSSSGKQGGGGYYGRYNSKNSYSQQPNSTLHP